MTLNWVGDLSFFLMQGIVLGLILKGLKKADYLVVVEKDINLPLLGLKELRVNFTRCKRNSFPFM